MMMMIVIVAAVRAVNMAFVPVLGENGICLGSQVFALVHRFHLY